MMCSIPPGSSLFAKVFGVSRVEQGSLINPFKLNVIFPLVSIGGVHFHSKCCGVIFFIFIQILIGHSVSKQLRP